MSVSEDPRFRRVDEGPRLGVWVRVLGLDVWVGCLRFRSLGLVSADRKFVTDTY